MKKLVLSIAMIAFIAGTASTAFGQVPDKDAVKARENLKEEKKDVVVAKKDLSEAKQDSALDYQKFTKEADVKFKTNEKIIADLRTNVTISTAADKSLTQKKLSVLEQKNNTLKRDLASYKVEGQTKWTTFKSEFNRDLDLLEKELKDFKY